MHITLTDPALMFPGISLLFLAYTNRYLALASVIRSLNKELANNDGDNRALQIKQLNQRVMLIKYMQAFGVLSFLFCVFAMMMLFWGYQLLGDICFVSSLVSMVASLLLSLIEILKSGDSLKIELDRTHINDLWLK